MEQIIVIGDVHGTQYWKNHLNFEVYKHIFLGDYFDDWHNKWGSNDQIKNLEEIIEVKKQYPEQIDLLIGNHDMAYLQNRPVGGTQVFKLVDIREFLMENLKYFDIAVEYNGVVFSHAGFSKTWMKNNKFTTIEEVNQAFHKEQFRHFLFCGYDCYGDDITQGPTWIRPRALSTDKYFDKQVVGHTVLRDDIHFDNIEIIDNREHSAYKILEV